MNQLAKQQNGEAGSGGAGAIAPSQYLTFSIAGETYATEILQVKEILRYDVITKVPSTPPSIRGVLNLRGSVVPVVDLAVKFGLPPSPVTRFSCVIIVEVGVDGERNTMGLMADSVSQVIDLGAGDIEPAPSFGTRVKVEYLRGMGRDGKKFVLLLDIERLITADETNVAQLAAPESSPTEPAQPQASA